MKWIEIIRVQAAGTQEQATLLEFTADLKKIPGLVEVDVYDQASAYGDFAVLLQWDTEQPQQEGSMEGLNLKQILKTFGLVNHTVWIVRENPQEQ